jgi:NAD(P)H-flavin reductase
MGAVPPLPVALSSREAVSRDLFKVGFDVPAVLADTFVTPGQYVELVIGSARGFFALASVPGAERWEIILRAGGGAADDLIGRALGLEVSLSGALGVGFPFAEVRGKSLVVAATELGIGAARSVVNQRIIDGDASRTEFLLGTREPATVPIVNELAQWESAGVSVLLCVTDAAAKMHYRGYIQDALRTLRPPNGQPRSADGAVFAVGRPELIDGLRAAAADIGLSAERVYTNY